MTDKKIVYFGLFEDGTGYSEAAKHTYLAMKAAGVNVVPRNIKLATQYVPPPKELYDDCSKDIQNVDTVIQHILPPFFNYIPGVKNIGYFHCETSHFRPSNWQYYCNLMDEIWVSCPENELAAKTSGVTKPIKVVPIPYNPETYTKSYPQIIPKDLHNKLIFYSIADWSSRKNLMSLIKVYLSTFSSTDEVVLVLKTYVEGTSSPDSMNIIRNDIENLKKLLRKNASNRWPGIILITDYLSPEQILGIHEAGDVYVNVEKGAAWCIPAMEALKFGNRVIANSVGGHNQFLRLAPTKCILLPSEMERVTGMDRCPYPDIYTCHERWFAPTEISIEKALVSMYNAGKIPKKPEAMEQFNYVNAGKRIGEML